MLAVHVRGCVLQILGKQNAFAFILALLRSDTRGRGEHAEYGQDALKSALASVPQCASCARQVGCKHCLRVNR